MTDITTDNLDEVYDIVDKNDLVISKATRREVHKDPSLIHRSVAVAVFNTKGEILMQQRSETKDTNPLQWTISCSGHVDAGDSYERAARRELKEELGVDLKILYIAKYIVEYEHETEMTMLYKAKSDGPFVYNTTEIKQIQFYSKEDLARDVQTKKIILSLSGKEALIKLDLWTKTDQ